MTTAKRQAIRSYLKRELTREVTALRQLERSTGEEYKEAARRKRTKLQELQQDLKHIDGAQG